MNELELKKAIAIEGEMWKGDGEITPEFELNRENLENRTDEVHEFLRLLNEKMESAKKEAKEWAERAKTLSDRIDRIEETVKNTMLASKLERISGKKHGYLVYKSGESVDWIAEQDFKKIPKKFVVIKTTVSLDKKLIKENFDKKLAKVLKLTPSYTLKPSKI